MPYTESLIQEHLRRIPVDDYTYGKVENRKTQVEHIIFTALTQINSAIQLALESEKDFDTIYGDRTIGESENWFLLQTLLKTLASENQINLDQFSEMLKSISDYFTE